MPLIVLRTNLPASVVDVTFADKLVNFLAETMEAKTEEVTLSIHTGVYLRMKNNFMDPMIYMDVGRINLDMSKTSEYAKAITSFFTTELNVPESRVLLWFQTAGFDEVALGGRTAEEIYMQSQNDSS